MPTFVHGSDTVVYLNGTDVSPMFSSSAFAGVAPAVEVTGFGAQDKVYIPGLRDATASLDGYFSSGTAEADALISAALGAGTVNVLSQWPAGDALASWGWVQPIIHTRYEIRAQSDDVVKTTFEGQSTQAEVHAQSLYSKASAAFTAAGTVAAVDGGAASSRGGIGAVQVFSGTVSAGTAVIEHSTTGTAAWSALGTVTFAGTAAATLPGQVGFGYFNVPDGTTINRFTRLNVAGLAGTCVLHASFGRR